MGLEYLKITPEIMMKISAYDEQQQGRLVMAMIAYALGGEEPQFDGMEKFVWPTLKMDIDRCTASIEKQTANGTKGGRPSKTQAKPTETHGNPEKPTETQAKPNESLNTNTNTNTNTNNKKEDVVDTRATAADEEDGVIGIDGTDLSAKIQINAEVDALLRTYKLPEAVRGDLLDDIAAHGLEKVKRVLQEAAKSDTRGGLSLNFFRACLKNDGKPRGAPGGRPDNMQRHQYTPEQYRAMITDLDAEDDSGKPKGKDGDRLLRYSKDDRKATYSAAVLDFDEEG